MTTLSSIPSLIASSQGSAADQLVRAVDQLDLVAFQAVLSQGRSLDLLADDGRNPYGSVLDALDECVRDQNSSMRMDILLDMAKCLKASGAEDFRPILNAAGSGNLPEVKRLIASGVPVNFAGTFSGTPLDVAIKEGHTEIVLFLKSIGGVERLPDPKCVKNFLEGIERLASVDLEMAFVILMHATQMEGASAGPNTFLLSIFKDARRLLIGYQPTMLGIYNDTREAVLLGMKRWEYRCDAFRLLMILEKTADSRRYISRSRLLNESGRSEKEDQPFSQSSEAETFWQGKSPLFVAVEAGDCEWASRLLKDGADPAKLSLRRVEFVSAGKAAICLIHLASPAHSAAFRHDMNLLVAMGESSGARQVFWKGLARSVMSFLGILSGRAGSEAVSAVFQRLAQTRQAVFRWEIPASQAELNRSLKRIKAAWSSLPAGAINPMEESELRECPPTLTADVVNQMVELALRNPRRLLRALPQGSWTPGKSVLEEIQDTTCAKHLSVLFETGLPLSHWRLIEALGEDLAALSNRIEVFATGEFHTREDFDVPLEVLKSELSGLCGRIRELAPDLPGTEPLIKKAGVDRSRSMDKWVRAMHGMLDDASPRRRQADAGEPGEEMPRDRIRGIVAPLSRPWLTEIRFLVVACKLMAISALPTQRNLP